MDDEHKEEFYDELADQLECDTGYPRDEARDFIFALYENGYFIAHVDDEELTLWQRLIRRFWR